LPIVVIADCCYCRLPIADCQFDLYYWDESLRKRIPAIPIGNWHLEIGNASIGNLKSAMNSVIRLRAPHNVALVNPARPGTEQR
jgi:hypothetical protein